jgi:predicted double-glycine peptidase
MQPAATALGRKRLAPPWAVAFVLIPLGPTTVPAQTPATSRVPAGASEPQQLQITTRSDTRLRPSVKSWKTLQREHIVMQQYDYSCGAAALTTLIVHYFQDQKTEQQVLNAIFERLQRAPNSQKLIEDRMKNGLSLLDLQQVAADLGYQSAVAKITLEQVRKLKAPVVVRIIKNDFKHFVVLRGIVEDRVFLADPIRGHLRMSEEEFVKQWNGVALFLGKEGFGLPKDHPLTIRNQSPVQHELQAARRAVFARP